MEKSGQRCNNEWRMKFCKASEAVGPCLQGANWQVMEGLRVEGRAFKQQRGSFKGRVPVCKNNNYDNYAIYLYV